MLLGAAGLLATGVFQEAPLGLCGLAALGLIVKRVENLLALEARATRVVKVVRDPFPAEGLGPAALLAVLRPILRARERIIACFCNKISRNEAKKMSYIRDAPHERRQNFVMRRIGVDSRLSQRESQYLILEHF